jgi:hypothetical protein
MNFLDVVSERHRVGAIHAIEKQKESLTLNPVHFSVVGDLDGSMPKCIVLLSEVWCIDSQLNWVGWSRKVVFCGDILADLYDHWFEILLFIRKLREQARAQGGDMTILSGNHEEFMLWYLIGEWANHWTAEIPLILKEMDMGNGRNKANWMTELYVFWNSRNEILHNMRQHETGKILLEEMTNMKLVEITGDTIHFHTPPNPKMLSFVSKSADVAKAVSDLNREWQWTLRALLLWDSSNSRAKSLYRIYSSIFLKTANDVEDSVIRRSGGHPLALSIFADAISSQNPQDYVVLKQNGIRTVVYGHTNSLLSVAGMEFITINRKSLSMNDPKIEESNPRESPIKIGSSQKGIQASANNTRDKLQKIFNSPRVIEFFKKYINRRTL